MGKKARRMNLLKKKRILKRRKHHKRHKNNRVQHRRKEVKPNACWTWWWWVDGSIHRGSCRCLPESLNCGYSMGSDSLGITTVPRGSLLLASDSSAGHRL